MSKKRNKIRTLALGIFWREDQILVSEGYDEVKQQTFYRPMGGRIEFGEYAHQTLAREIKEEIEAEIAVGRYLTTLENIFTYNAENGHEIVMLFEARFIDPTLYQREVFEGYDDHQKLFNAYWKPLDDFEGGDPPLYPEGLLDLLQTERRRSHEA
jgi:8-oxo-dGTP pyrophosphatase MutT (NUDIX family)